MARPRASILDLTLGDVCCLIGIGLLGAGIAACIFMVALVGLSATGMAVTCGAYYLGFGKGVGDYLRMDCWSPRVRS